MEPSLILFDIDGTLVDTAGAGRLAIEDAFGAVFGPEARNGVDGFPFGGMTDPKIFRGIALRIGLDDDRFDRAWTALRASYLEALDGHMDRPDPRRRVLPGVRELLDGLTATADVHLGLLTGNMEAGARRKLEPFGLNRYFADGGFGSDHADRSEIARIARDKLSRLLDTAFPPDRVIVIGDTPLDVACARANGFRALAVASGWSSKEALAAAAPDVLLDNLGDPREVAGALTELGSRSPQG